MAAEECGECRKMGWPPLTGWELGLDAPPPQGPLAQHHIATFPPDLEDAQKQNPLGHGLWEKQGHEGRPLLQGAHPAPAFPPEHGGQAARWANLGTLAKPFGKEECLQIRPGRVPRC